MSFVGVTAAPTETYEFLGGLPERSNLQIRQRA